MTQPLARLDTRLACEGALLCVACNAGLGVFALSGCLTSLHDFIIASNLARVRLDEVLAIPQLH